ncbi:putative acyl-CoA-binding protein [Anthonomus grandis grandis]|uniref:putative acyl-CoA-binding protein n=1 Tax=Anthonomus grandis grandis TaxID=2921223 RepID=UPI00216642BB|nr:putative acyl-CoA-binding protein [Anthonomus grandis grandis]
MHGEISERFISCRNVSAKYGCPPSVSDGLELYGLLKQATKGNISKEKPSAFNLVESAKWSAWNGKKGMTKEQAMEQFIETVKRAYSCTC